MRAATPPTRTAAAAGRAVRMAAALAGVLEAAPAATLPALEATLLAWLDADEATEAAEEVAEAAAADEPLEKWTPVVAEVTTELDKMTSVLTGVTEVKVVSDGRAVRVEAEREVMAED